MITVACLSVLLGASLPLKSELSTTAVAVQRAQPKLVLTIEKRGSVEIELFQDTAPKTVQHIADLARKGFYDGLQFFRVIKEPRPFLVQIGDPQTRSKSLEDPALGSGGSGTRVAFEASGHKHVRGAVGLSTLPGDKNSGDSQFYIMLADHGFLDENYTVFGRVTKGMDVVDSIALGDSVSKATLQ